MDNRATPTLRLLGDIKKALDKLVESIREYQQSETAQGKPKPETEPKVVVRLPVEITEHYATEKAERPKRNRNDNIRLGLEVVGVIAAISLAIVTLCTLLTLNGQLKQAKRANNDLENQFAIQQRPWVGLAGVIEFPKQPVFRVYPSNIPARSEIDLNVAFKIRNFGPSPAFKTASDIQVWEADNTIRLPQTEMDIACGRADGNMGGESVIFPSSEIPLAHEVISSRDIELTKIRRIWVMGCISYQDNKTNITHHTKFWIMSYMIEGSPPLLP